MTVHRQGSLIAAGAVVVLGMVPAFWLYIDAMTPPSDARDLLIHIFFFPLVFPVVPVFLDGAFDLGGAAYAVYPAIALAIVLAAGTHNPLRLASIALATAFLLPWSADPATTVMGYEAASALTAVTRSPLLSSAWVLAIPVTAAASAIAADGKSGGALLLVSGLVTGAAVLTGFGFTLAAGGWAALAAATAACGMGGLALSRR